MKFSVDLTFLLGFIAMLFITHIMVQWSLNKGFPYWKPTHAACGASVWTAIIIAIIGVYFKQLYLTSPLLGMIVYIFISAVWTRINIIWLFFSITAPYTLLYFDIMMQYHRLKRRLTRRKDVTLEVFGLG